MRGERLVAVGTSNGEHFENEFDMLHSQIFGQQSNERSPEGFSKASPEEIENLRNSPMISHKDPDWERGAPAVQELLDIPQEENDRRYQELKDYSEKNPSFKVLGDKPLEAGVVQMRKDFPATQDYLKYIQKYNPQDVDAYDAGDFVIFKKRPSVPPVVGKNEDTKLFFVRHGETEENEEDLIREKNSRLTDKGRKQAETAAKQLKSEGVDAIVSSNLPRAKESAHIIAAKLGIVPQFDDRLNTWDVGSLEGKPCSEGEPIMRKLAEKDQDTPAGGAESFNDFKDRAFSGIRDAINNNQDKKLAILTHSKVEGAIKAWNATGQDNPDLDYKKVNQQGDAPGSVEPFTMKADSTIMQQNTNTFAERFPKETQNLPFINDAPIDKGVTLPGWWRNESVKKDPELDEYPGQHEMKNYPKDMEYFPDRLRNPLDIRPGLETIKTMPYDPEGSYAKDLMYRPTSEYKPFSPSQEKSIEDLAAKHKLDADKVKNFLMDLKPEDIIGTNELGMARYAKIPESTIKSMVDMVKEGTSVKDIAKKLGMGVYQVKDQLGKLRQLPKSGKESVPDWFKQEMEDTLEKEYGLE